MSPMRRIDAASVLLLALCLGCLLARLAAVPSLSLDEAWIGLFATRLRAAGLYTPHQMNHYTGPLYARLVALFFDAKGVSIESLRLPGALLNAAAVTGLWLHLRRRVSPEAGAAWLVLVAASAFLLMKSRLAWEVYALHPLLILGTLTALASPGGGPALAFLTVIGVQNHFIYLSIPASLVVMFGARAAWRGEKAAEPKLRDAAAALAAGLAFALVKHPISEEAWVAHRAALTAALVLAPALAAVAVRRTPLELLVLPFNGARRQLRVLFALTITAFVVWHLAPLVQIFAGPVVFKRLFSYQTPLGLSVVQHAWGVFLAATLVWHAVRAWHDDSLDPHERTLLLWPAAYAAVFIAFRHTSSLRYYSLPALLSLIALAAALPRMARADKKALYLCAAAAALMTQTMLWREIVSPADRPPLKFHVGWRKENSKDFSRKDGLFAAFDASRACIVAHAERSFTAIPLYFHLGSTPRPCEPSLAFDSDQCPDCSVAPYYRWEVVPVAK